MQHIHRHARFYLLTTISTAFFAALLWSSVAYAASDPALPNPLKSEYSSIPGFIRGALLVMVKVSIPILTLFIVYSGFRFVTARGNPGKLESARMNFVYVIIGALLILGAWAIATLIGGTIKQLTDTDLSYTHSVSIERSV